MADLPAGMQTHLDAEVTSLCHAWRLILANGIRLGFTDHDQKLEIGGDSFEPHSGLTASEARESLGLSVDAMDVAGALSSEAIAAEDIAAGRFDNAAVETLLVNWQDTDQSIIIRRAVIGRITTTDNGFSAELESANHRLDQPSGRIIRRTCDAEVGDARCGVDLAGAGFSATALITAVNPPDAVLASGIEEFPSGWLTGGWLVHPGSGARTRIAAHIAGDGNANLRVDSLIGLQTGMMAELTAGCDKSFGACKSKFANAVNFRGFPHLPGNDAAYSHVTEDAVFDGRPLVP